MTRRALQRRSEGCCWVWMYSAAEGVRDLTSRRSRWMVAVGQEAPELGLALG